ncbi:MAG: shikimate dehydrogenase [Actinomycetes bacterium]
MSPRIAGVLGHPITHSLSPTLHQAAYGALGLDWEYDRHDVEPAGLAAFVDGCGPEWVGLSLTMPLKSTVIALLDQVSALADMVESVNTVSFIDGQRVGDNTDVPGMVAAIRRATAGPIASATILGGGATSRSALAASAELGASQAAVYVRRPEAGESMRPLAQSLGIDLMVEPWERAAEGLLADLVVSTVPVGVADGLAEAVVWSSGVLHDVVYAPWPTPLALAWSDHGGLVVPGIDLLIEQAALQVHLWTGLEPPLAVMREAVGAE